MQTTKYKGIEVVNALHRHHLVVEHSSISAWKVEVVMPRVLRAIRTQARPQSQEFSWFMWGTYKQRQTDLNMHSNKMNQKAIID